LFPSSCCPFPLPFPRSKLFGFTAFLFLPPPMNHVFPTTFCNEGILRVLPGRCVSRHFSYSFSPSKQALPQTFSKGFSSPIRPANHFLFLFRLPFGFVSLWVFSLNCLLFRFHYDWCHSVGSLLLSLFFHPPMEGGQPPPPFIHLFRPALGVFTGVCTVFICSCLARSHPPPPLLSTPIVEVFFFLSPFPRASISFYPPLTHPFRCFSHPPPRSSKISY